MDRHILGASRSSQPVRPSAGPAGLGFSFVNFKEHEEPAPPPLGGGMAQGGGLGNSGLMSPHACKWESFEVPKNAEVEGKTEKTAKRSKHVSEVLSSLYISLTEALATLRQKAGPLFSEDVARWPALGIDLRVNEQKHLQCQIERAERQVSIVEKTLRSTRFCRSSGIDHPIIFSSGKKDGSSLVLKGLFTCGQKNICPHCAAVSASKNALAAREAFERWSGIGANYRLIMITLTIPSVPFGGREMIFLVLRLALRKMMTSRAGEKFRSAFPYEGFLRAVEIMYSKDKCHPHIHMVFFVKQEDIAGFEDTKEYELSLSNLIHGFWDKAVKAAVRCERSKRKKEGNKEIFAPWIDPSAKEVVKAPYAKNRTGEETRIAGGVTAEIAKTTDQLAKYLAKELSYSHEKTGEEGLSYSWQALIDLSKKEQWARSAFEEHVLLSNHLRGFEWSRHDMPDGGKKSFFTWIQATTPEPKFLEERRQEKASQRIVATGELLGVLFTLHNDDKNDYALARGLDLGGIAPDLVDFEKISNGRFQNVGQDEETQAFLLARMKAEYQMKSEQMREGKRRAAEKRKKNYPPQSLPRSGIGNRGKGHAGGVACVGSASPPHAVAKGGTSPEQRGGVRSDSLQVVT